MDDAVSAFRFQFIVDENNSFVDGLVLVLQTGVDMAAVKTLCCVYVLITSAWSDDSHRHPHGTSLQTLDDSCPLIKTCPDVLFVFAGLFCTHDLVQTVTCNSSLVSRADCWISGTKNVMNYNPRRLEPMT